MKKSRVFILLAVAVTIFIFTSSMQTAEVSSGASGRLLTLINKLLSGTSVTITQRTIRKFAHFAEFFMQGFFLSLAAVFSARGMKKHLINIAFTGLLTACTDELIQTFFDGRGAQVKDIFIDFGGTVTAIILIFLLAIIVRRVKDVRLR